MKRKKGRKESELIWKLKKKKMREERKKKGIHIKTYYWNVVKKEREKGGREERIEKREKKEKN